MFLTPTSKEAYGVAWLGGRENFEQNVSQDIDKVEKIHKDARKANRSKPKVTLGTHAQKIDGIHTTKGERTSD